MIVKSKSDILNIILDSECTIAEIQEDFDKIKNLPETTEKIELVVDKLEEIDTAYFQMLLSLKAWAKQNKGSFSVSGTAAPIEEISKLYGVEL